MRIKCVIAILYIVNISKRKIILQKIFPYTYVNCANVCPLRINLKCIQPWSSV